MFSASPWRPPLQERAILSMAWEKITCLSQQMSCKHTYSISTLCAFQYACGMTLFLRECYCCRHCQASTEAQKALQNQYIKTCPRLCAKFSANMYIAASELKDFYLSAWIFASSKLLLFSLQKRIWKNFSCRLETSASRSYEHQSKIIKGTGSKWYTCSTSSNSQR